VNSMLNFGPGTTSNVALAIIRAIETENENLAALVNVTESVGERVVRVAGSEGGIQCSGV